MTTREPTDASSDNSGARPDASHLYDYIEEHEPTTLDELSTRAGITETRVKALLKGLEHDGYITVTAGLRAVHVATTENASILKDVNDDLQEPVDADDAVRTDGGGLLSHEPTGLLRRVVDTVTSDVPELPLTESELYEVLSAQRRRALIRIVAVLATRDGESLTVRKAATLLATGEADQQTTADDVHRCYVAITQTHAPLLDDYGVLEYHPRVQKLTGTEHTVILARLLDQNSSLLTDSNTAEGEREENDSADIGGG